MKQVYERDLSRLLRNEASEGCSLFKLLPPPGCPRLCPGYRILRDDYRSARRVVNVIAAAVTPAGVDELSKGREETWLGAGPISGTGQRTLLRSRCDEATLIAHFYGQDREVDRRFRGRGCVGCRSIRRDASGVAAGGSAAGAAVVVEPAAPRSSSRAYCAIYLPPNPRRRATIVLQNV